jgi:hypothetical protein
VSIGHSCHGIRTSAGLQEKFCDVCGSQFDINGDLNIVCRHCWRVSQFFLSSPLAINQTRSQHTSRATSSKKCHFFTTFGTVKPRENITETPSLERMDTTTKFIHFKDNLALSEHERSAKPVKIYPVIWKPNHSFRCTSKSKYCQRQLLYLCGKATHLSNSTYPWTLLNLAYKHVKYASPVQDTSVPSLLMHGKVWNYRTRDKIAATLVKLVQPLLHHGHTLCMDNFCMHDF